MLHAVFFVVGFSRPLVASSAHQWPNNPPAVLILFRRRALGRCVTPKNSHWYYQVTINNTSLKIPALQIQRARRIRGAAAPWLFCIIAARSSRNAQELVTTCIQCIACTEKSTMLDNLDTITKHVGIASNKDASISDAQKKVFILSRFSCRFFGGITSPSIVLVSLSEWKMWNTI